MCDGFSAGSGSKDLILSTRLKILCLLSDKDLSPAELISTIGVAKSNLANLSKSMIDDGVIESYKTADNLRHVYYRITSKGADELKVYKSALLELITDQSKYDIGGIEKNIDSLISAIKRK